MTLHPRSVMAHGLRKRKDWADAELVRFLVTTFEMKDGQAWQTVAEFRMMDNNQGAL